MIVIVWYICS